MNSLADRLSKALQQKKGLTQAGLARACGVKPPSVSDWINGKTKTIEAANLINAAEYLGVRAKWLATGKGRSEINEPTAAHHAAEHIDQQFESTSNKVKQALDVLESALTNMDMSGRERIAPLFESFARSPGSVIKDDIATLLNGLSPRKSKSVEAAALHKTG